MYHKFCWEKETLASLQDSAKTSEIYSGVCAEEWDGDIYSKFMMQVMDVGDEGYVYIMAGDVTGTVCDGVVIFPTEIVEEYYTRKIVGFPYPTIEII